MMLAVVTPVVVPCRWIPVGLSWRRAVPAGWSGRRFLADIHPEAGGQRPQATGEIWPTARNFHFGRWPIDPPRINAAWSCWRWVG